MYAEELLSRDRVLATHGSFVFVAIDQHGQPIPVRDDA
jgi:acyl-CoA hydrolase